MNNHISGEDLAAYVDGRLQPEKKSELENHFSRCPACQDELVEITAIMGGRDKVLAGNRGKVPVGNRGKIPAEFLKLALGEKNKTAKSVLHLRLVFEIAAVFVVVVFIGYLFLSGNRFWPTQEGQKPSVVMDKNVRPGDAATVVRNGEMAPLQAQRRDLADARKTKSERVEADAGQSLADLSIPPKRISTVAVAGMPAAKAGSGQTNKQEIELQESAAAPEAFGDVQMDFAAKENRVAKGKVEAVADAKQNLEKKKDPGAAVALAIEPREEKLKDETSRLRASAAVLPTVKAGQPALPPVRIEGDVAWTDLRNPELVFTWSWFQKDLVLELQIDDAGTVTAVVPLGKIDPLLARQAENEAKKLLFSVSEKKSRRARLIANELPLN